MFLTYRYLLRPNKRQDAALDFQLWQSCEVYNAALAQRIEAYKENGRTPGFFEQSRYFRKLRHTQLDTLGQLNAKSLNQTLRRLDKAYASFFRRLKKKNNKRGFPQFKSRKDFKSFEYEYNNGCRLRFYADHRVRLYLQNIGEIRICYHRPIPNSAEIKHVSIKRINERWYVFFMVKIQETQPKSQSFDSVGVDVGLISLLAFSDKTLIPHPHWFLANHAHLRVLQRTVARRQKSSNRRAKALKQAARLFEKITNQRHDYLHKVTRNLVNQYALIAIEDLSLGFMNQNKYLAGISLDAGLGTFRRLLEYKAEAAGVQVVAVTPYNTSQRCSGCGELVPKDLDTRVHACPQCGLVLDRDVNAARNILQAALAQVNTQ